MKRVEFEGVIHEFPDDFTDAEISASLDGYSRMAAAGPAPAEATAAGIRPKAGNYNANWRRGLRKSIPTVAATAASLAVPELALPGWLAKGAGLATAAARSAASAGAGAATSRIAGTDPSNEARLQGGATLAGELLPRGLRAAGNALLVDAYRVGKPLAEQFPMLDRIIREERIPVGGRFSREGTNEAKARMLSASDDTKSYLSDAGRTGIPSRGGRTGRAGVKIDPRKAVKPLDALIRDLDKTAGMEGQADAMRKLRRDFLELQGAPMKPLAAKAEKKRYGGLGSKVLAAEKKSGAPPLPQNEKTMAQGYAALEEGIRKEMNAQMPDLRALEAVTQGRIGLLRALADVEPAKLPMLTDRLLTPRAFLGPLGSPQAQSRLGLALSGFQSTIPAWLAPRGIALGSDLSNQEER